MGKSICGADCSACQSKDSCKGCVETKGCPFGKQCFVGKYILVGGMENYRAFKQGLIDEVNALNVDGMEKVSNLYPLVGSYVNLSYELPSGESVKFLKDDEVYLGAQVKNIFDDSGKTCYGVIARENFIIVCEYDEGCANSEIVIFKSR